VVLDDRGERPGAMFADWELIGIPQRVVVSERGLKDGLLEVQGRRDAQPASVPVAELPAYLKARLRA
jgi:prolyl-tRNA synthetase